MLRRIAPWPNSKQEPMFARTHGSTGIITYGKTPQKKLGLGPLQLPRSDYPSDGFEHQPTSTQKNNSTEGYNQESTNRDPHILYVDNEEESQAHQGSPHGPKRYYAHIGGSQTQSSTLVHTPSRTNYSSNGSTTPPRRNATKVRGYYDLVAEAEASTSRKRTNLDTINEIDNLEHEVNYLQSMFDQLPNETPTKRLKKGRQRTEKYGTSEGPAKRKAHHRAMKVVKKKLDYLAEMHQDTQFFFYARSSARQSVVLVSNGLRGIDTSRSLNFIHTTLEEYACNARPMAAVSYADRFSDVIMNPTCDDAWLRFVSTQTAKSVKPIYSMFQRAQILTGERMKNANHEWYMSQIKTLFLGGSRTISTLMLWSALSNLQYHGSIGVGYKYAEFKKKHFIGLMQSLDLLAAARGEPPLPKYVDFAGNLLANCPSSHAMEVVPNQTDSIESTDLNTEVTQVNAEVINEHASVGSSSSSSSSDTEQEKDDDLSPVVYGPQRRPTSQLFVSMDIDSDDSEVITNVYQQKRPRVVSVSPGDANQESTALNVTESRISQSMFY